MKHIKLIAALLLVSGASFAVEEARHPRPVACAEFSTAKTSTGTEIGLCAPTKAGGKPRVLRSFAVTSLMNPASEKVERVMVGYP